MKLKGVQRKSLRARLLDRGMTLMQFANENGFKYDTVQKVLYRYLNNPDYKPHGTLTNKILSCLDKYV